MFSNSTNNRLLSAALLDQEQLEETQRLQRLGETQRRSVSALLLPSSTRCQSAPDPVTEGFFGSKLFGRLMSRQSSSRRSEGESLVSQFGLLDVEQRVSSRRGSVRATGADINMVSMLDREQLSSSRSRKRSYSLVSMLDNAQTQGKTLEQRSSDQRPRELTQLNTLQQAIPVARAAARFRAAVDHDDGEDDHEKHSRHRHRHRRKSHSLY